MDHVFGFKTVEGAQAVLQEPLKYVTVFRALKAEVCIFTKEDSFICS